MEEEIKAEFEKYNFSLDQEDEILKKCLTFCINFKLKPSDLVKNWEVYCLNRSLSGKVVENAHMDGFMSHLQHEQKEMAVKEEAQHQHVYSNKDVDMISTSSDEHEVMNVDITGTPPKRQESELYNSTPGTNGTIHSSRKPSRLDTNHMTPFGQRTNKFVVQFAMNTFSEENGARENELTAHEDDVIRRVQPSERCSLEVQVSQPKPGCRFMYERIEDKFNSLENRLRRHATAFAASGFYEELADPTIASEKSVFSVGMVCCDGEGPLNENSILLQGSADHCEGRRVRLDLQKLPQFSLFPGQVIGIEGNNLSGHYMIPSKVVDSIPFSLCSDVDLHPAKKQAMDQEFRPASPSSLSLVIAAGPYTTTDNLLFEPLTDLLAYASRKQVQLLILLGPFIDSEHPEIKKGTVNRSFDEIFNLEILRRLQDYVEYMGSTARVILVPSIRDASHDFVFPQPAFSLPAIVPKNQITCLTNPGFFSANKVKVGCCTVDILKHLSAEEISRIPADGSRDRIGRLATHVLSQRSFYPLYPPSENVPLDMSLAPEALQLSSLPDILILPSDLASFVKILSLGEKTSEEEQIKCLAVNPGRLAKGVGGGTFVELKYHGNPETTNASLIRI